MNEDTEKRIRGEDGWDLDNSGKEEYGFSSTLKISRKTFMGKIPTTQHAFLEIMGDKKERIELGEEDLIIGRIPDCDIQLMVGNVSRRHARIFYRNEEYQIEDLGSTNGIYINGIKVEKCILRGHDIIEIGGVKILFVEEKINKK